jgi:hypothetical protein
MTALAVRISYYYMSLAPWVSEVATRSSTELTIISLPIAGIVEHLNSKSIRTRHELFFHLHSPLEDDSKIFDLVHSVNAVFLVLRFRQLTHTRDPEVWFSALH